MALVLKDRVKETCAAPGLGTVTLLGAVTEYQSFSAIGDGNTTYYTIIDQGGTNWEVGIGTYTASGTTLSRDTVLASSNSGSKVNFSTGTQFVWCDYPAGKAVYLDASGSISEPIVNISGITGAISTVDTIGFDTTYSTALTAGQLGWDGNNTLGIGMAGGNVTQHIGEDQFFYCKASSAITKGQVVMFTGAVGASGVPTGAPATGIADGTYIMGIAAESIALNGFGLVQTFGTLRNVNTSGYADGEILWYNPAVTGGLTATKPSAPNVKVQMAAVINGGSSGGGTILIRINSGSTLGGTDSNAQIGTPVNGQVITYDNNAGYWKNTSIASGTGISVSAATDGTLTVTNTAPSSGGTVTSVGTGTGLTGGPITSSGTISLDNTTVSAGSYTNSSITVDAQGRLTAASSGTAPVTSVTGTAPVVSSGGTTPAISMAAANSTTNGYLTSTDWTTFNSKGSGTVTSVDATVPSIFSVSGVPITGTGTIAMTYSGTALPVANGGTGQTSLTANNVILGNGTSGVTVVAPGTSGNVLTSNGTTWVSSASSGGGGFPSGTVMLFAQTSAPTGWTKSTTHNNKALRVVSGTAGSGGSVDFTTAFASGLNAGNTTLSISQIPSHNHSGTYLNSISAGGQTGVYYNTNRASTTTGNVPAEGGGGSHNHTLPSFDVAYVDVILASKD